ncbi:hypothetical protein FD06_GL000276 [Apilactobacillus ozensis DSM 23829 = JCM 17196]|uniref:Phage protein n=2 Tax=Apilactobacillus ozensis TaxID=866801 RepID=A0A0R2APW2_9LACO|nr:DUF2634 domain-containing protein [Apilactobacillus ozensis]KRM69217.1 hypothetical protein FD06_GL000276 [Apilactobacillus ozensis DSM 23829 = JCM 17196]
MDAAESVEEVQDDGLQDDLGDDYEEVTLPSKTYRVKNNRIISFTDGYNAMLQAIDKALQTERFVWLIYNEDYGNDIQDLVGKDFEYIKVEVARMIDECLLSDDRVISTDIDNITKVDKDSILIEGTCETIFGPVDIRKEENLSG